jgi:transcriptional regulator of acetoin/glycerol metabolism
VRLSGEIGALPGEGKLDWNEMERRMIAEALLKSRGNRSTAANLLGWGRATLWRKMKRHGLS